MRFILIAFLAAIFGASGALAAGATAVPASNAAAPAPPALKIGYVDFSRVWNEYRRRGEFDSEYKALRLELGNQDRSRAEEIARYSAQIEKLSLGTPERLELEEKAKAAVKEEEEFRRKGAEELNEKFISLLNRLVAEVLQETAAIAKEGNYDLIIKDQTPDPSVASRDAAVLQLGERVVLYAKPEYDLTDAVIKRLNDKYAAELKKKETAPNSTKQPETPAKEK
jgi:Skp family chaperone for outer membrane proteins